jgi:hypothetical protein
VIEGYIGIPGAGKTLSMTVRAFKHRNQYAEIITNYSLDFPECKAKIVRFTDADELLGMLSTCLDAADEKKRLVLLDEVHLIFDARMWANVPPEFLRILAQPRKAGLDMYYTAQHESQVEKRLRTVTNWLWLCRSWGKDFNFVNDTPIVFWAKCFDAFEFRNPRARDYGSRVYRFKKKWGHLYDTLEVLQRMEMPDPPRVGKVSPPEPGVIA